MMKSTCCGTLAARFVTSTLTGVRVLILGLVLMSVSESLFAQACSGFNSIGGVVFSDYNADGAQGTLENGVQDVTVTAYDANGNVYGPVATNATGNYVLSVPNEIPVRLEFTGLPDNLVPTSVGENSVSSVAFITSPNCEAGLAVNNPADYCQANPQVITPCYINGDPLGGGTAGTADVLVGFPFDSEGVSTAPAHLSFGSEIGSVWGAAYNRESNELFTAAFLKRFSGLGSLGLGGIYVTNLNSSPVSNSEFIDLAALGINVGSIGARGLGPDVTSVNQDSEAFGLIGKIGLGDIDISDDGNTLYAINLAQSELVSIDISNYNANGTMPTAANVNSVNIPNPGCSNGDFAPFGLKVKNGSIYIGVVCTGETSGLRSDMNATVYEYSAGSFSSLVSVSLDYAKGTLTNFSFSDNCDHWEPWSNDYADFYHTNLPNGICYPQPVLSDIEFDVDGSIMLGFMDRAGHQLGRSTVSDPTPGSSVIGTGVAGGDIIRVYNNGGSYVVENNGSAGNAGCGQFNGQGIGGGEYYCGDAAAGGEQESSMGSLAIMPGSGVVINTSLNPFTTNSGGLNWMNNQTGQSVRKFQLYSDAPQFMGKAHGLGDLEVLCEPAPIEIGNYVWNDVNGNGIQEPGEPGIPNVIINLYDEDGTLVTTTTSDVNGQYFFNDANVPGGIEPGTPYVMAVSPFQYGPNGITIGPNNFGPVTDANVGEGIFPDMNDSDAIADNNSGIAAIDDNDLPYIEFTIDGPGQTNHDLDFGFGEEDCEYEISDISLSSDEVCSGDQVIITLTHTPDLGPLGVYYNVGSVLTATELYENGEFVATTIDSSVDPATGLTTTQVVFVFPENTTGSPFPYNVYGILGEDNPNASVPSCMPYDFTPITVYPNPTANASSNSPVCEGETIQLFASGGTTYQWTGPNGFISNQQNPQVFNATALNAGLYTVSVTNFFGCTDEATVNVVVGSAIANAGPDQTICNGEAATLTATGGGTYQWSNGQTGSTNVVNPTTTTTYTVTVSDANGCQDIDQVTVTVGSATANAGPDQTICLGSSATLIANGGGTYQWSNGITSSINTVSPTVTTTYSVTVSDFNGCQDVDQVTVTVTDVTANAGPDQTICLGNSATLTASGGGTYQWNTGQTGSTIIVNPSVTTTYTVTIQSAEGCIDTDQVIVTVGDAIANAGPDQTICLGEAATLTATGGGTYQWSNGITSSINTVSPIVTTTYTVTVTNGEGCQDIDQVTVTVGSATANAGPDQTICLGESTVLSASGGSNYQWSSGQTSSSIVVAPTATTTYSVTVSDFNGCTDVDEVTVVVGSATAEAGPDQTICQGSSATLSATGGVTYQWSNGQTGSTIVVNPFSTTTYTVIVTDINGCQDSDSVTVTVGNAIANAGPDDSICLGESTTLTASGGSSYQWSNGGSTATINVSPTATTTYTVTVSDGNGCVDTDEVTVSVSNVTANAGPDATICLGSTSILSATGGTQYQWSTGQTSSSIVVNPTTTTTYTVTVSNFDGCQDVDQVTVTVGSATADAGPDQTICLGSSATLSATGGSNYQWSTGQATATISVSPTFTTTYTVTVSDNNGCQAIDQVTVTVGSSIAEAGPDQTICLGSSATLIASGGNTYAWSNGVTSSINTVSPTTTTTYTVTVSDANGCEDVDQVTVTVGSATADAGPDQTICLGETAIVAATGGVNYQWSTGQTSASIVVSPNITTTYSVTVSDNNGCQDVDQMTVTVGSANADAGPDQTICDGASATLSATGGTNYQWSTGQATATIVVNPTTTTTYTVTVSDVNGCQDIDQVTVTVGSAIAQAGPDQTICLGESTILSASGGSSYQWSTGSNSSSVVVNPSVTTTYSVTVSDFNGCTDVDEVTVTVGSANAEAGPDQTICQGSSATLSATGGVNYQWSTGQTGATIVVNPFSTTTYTVIVTDINGCQDSDSVTVTVGNATANAGPDQTICLGESTTLSATGGTNYQWSTGATTASTSVNPSVTTTYTVTVSDINGCQDVDQVTVTVGDAIAEAGPDQTICNGATAILSATGGGTYQWSTGQSSSSIVVNPSVTTTYSVTVTTFSGCVDTDEVTVTVGSATANAGPDQTICQGETAVLTATGGTQYQWSNGQLGASITVNPFTTTTYTVNVTDANGCTDSDSVTVTVGSATADAGPDQTICLGGSATLSATGGTNYQWSTGQATATIVVNPSATTTYTVTVSDINGCQDVDQVTVSVGSAIANAGPDATICLGEATVLSASGGSSYQWSTGQSSAGIVVSPTVTTTYTVTVSDPNGCTDVDEVTVTVGSANADAGPDQTICQGSSATLSATGGVTYQWSNGQTGATIVVNPFTTTTYTVIVTDINGCQDSDSVTVTVGSATAEAGPDQTICLGSTAVLSASGGTNYQWSTGETSATISVSPSANTTYTVTVSDANGCQDVDEVTVTVSDAIAEAGPDQTICLGETTILSATGGSQYQWSTGQTSSSIVVNPSATTTYSVTVTDFNGCVDTDEVTVTVGSATANAGPDQTICLGESTVLNATGGTQYQWSNGQTTASITVNPTFTTTYTVVVTDANGCTDVDEVTVTVSSVTANAGPDQTICEGTSASLTATGGSIYAWSTGQSGATIVVNPSTTTTYTVTVSDANGCQDVDQVTVTVGSAIADAGPDQVICLGETAILAATGGSQYQWSTGQTSSSIVVNPSATTTYSVTVSDFNGCTDVDEVTVTVGNATAEAGPDQVICLGEAATLSATGGVTYQWSNGQTNATIVVNPTFTTTYTVIVTDANGCQDSDSVTVTVGSATANAGPDQTICLGSSTTLSASGGANYIWSTGQTSATIVVSPTTTTSYTVTVSDGNGCTAVDEVTVTVGNAIAEAGPDQTICLGSTAVLSATGGVTYQWSNGQASATIVVNPSVTTTYSVTVSDVNGCQDTDSVTVTVGSANADAGPDQTICLGESTVLNATGGSNYQWSTGQATSSITVSPTVTTTYTVTVSDVNGCTDVDQVTVTVGSAIAEAGPDQTICLGSSAVLNATGGSNYQWSTGQTSSSIVVNPTATTTYTVTVSDFNGCQDVDQVTVTVGSATADAGPDQTICLGETATLNATGGSNYQWSNGQTSASIVVNPTFTTSYSVTVSDVNGCTAVDQVTVTVGSAIAEAGPDQTICLGEAANLTATGGVSFQWSSGQTSASITVNPSSTTTYSVTVTDINGCQDEDSVTVVVGSATANAGPDQTICLGETTILSASGGVNYQWSTGQSSSSIVVNPTTTTTYTVTVSDNNGCTAVDEVVVTVGSAIAEAGPDQTICNGESATLSATGGVTYQWSNGQTGATIVVNPFTTTTYTVIVTDINGCQDSDTVTVTVGSATANAGPDQTICLGESTVLTASGGTNYQWSTGDATATISVNPSTTTTYTVTVSDANGCTDVDQVTVTVGSAIAEAGPDQTICLGETSILSATGGVSYQWSNGQTSATIVVNPSTTTTYSVTVSDINGCQDVDSVTVTVGSATADAGPDQVICLGEATTLSATGGINYQWSTGQTGATISVSPTFTTTYTVTVSDNNGCSDIDQVTVTVGSANADAGPDQTICLGEATTLNATGGVTYQWSNGGSSATISVNPSTTTTYTVTVTDANGCQDVDQVTVTVGSATADAGPDQVICLGETTILSASGGVNYQWSTGQNSASIVVNPTTTTTYTVTVSDNNGCTAVDEVVVTVGSAIAEAGPDQVICLGEAATLSATGGVTYQWSNGQTSATIVVNPTFTTTYTVIVTDINGCQDTDTVTVTVGSAIANAGPDQTICLGESTTISATGGVSYQWSTGQTSATIVVNPTATTTYSVTVSDVNGCTDTDEMIVTVGNAIAEAGPDQVICLGETSILTATGGVTYQWSNGQSGSTIVVNPSATTTYSVTVTDINGCQDSDSVTVTVGSATADAGPDQVICLGESTILNATGGTNYQWSTGQATASITVSPTFTTTYTVTVSDVNGCTDIDQVTVTVGSAVAEAGPDQVICLGETTILNASGGVNYQWSTGQTSSSITVNPTATTTYTVTVSDINGCQDVDQVTVTVGSATADAGPDQTICLGESTTLSATGGVNYQWSTGQTGATISVSPTFTTTYTVTVSDNNGCSDVDQVTVTVGSATAEAGPDQVICLGESTTLNATGGVTYQWSNGGSSATISVNPSTTTTYTVTVTDANGCQDVDQVTVTVGSATADAGPDQVICLGETTILSATGGSSYQWSTGQTSASIVVNPTTTTTYSVTVSDINGCTDVDEVVVTVGQAIAEAGPDQVICLGEAATLSATGGVTYQWSNGQSGATIVVNPTFTTTYTVIVTDINGCQDTDTVTVTVGSAVANAGPDQTICLGESATISATGGVSYQWSTGQTSATIVVNPTATTTYSVTVSDVNGCTDTDEMVVTVGNAVAEAGPDQIICLGETSILTATGGVSYQWSNGQTSASIVVNPTATTTYTVTVTDINGCQDTDSVTVTVGSAVANAGPDQTICLGESTTLSATGGVNYQWSTGQTGATISVSPTFTTTYTVTVSDVNGCSDIDQVTVTVGNAVANAGPDQTICLGETTILNATGGVTYAWSNGSTSASTTVNPTTTTTYTVTVTDINGCQDVDDVTVSVSNTTANAGLDQTICLGETAVLSATGGVTYQWSTGQASSTITVNPTVTTTYSVTVTNIDGCQDVDEVTVNVSSVTAEAGPDQTICNGEDAILTASGGATYVWSTGQTGATIIVDPTFTTTYTVTVTNLEGCIDVDQVTVSVSEAMAIAGEDVTICVGETVTLTASGGVSYIWNTGETSQTIIVNPSTSQTYTVLVTNEFGCKDVDQVHVSVTNASANAGSDQAICLGESTILNASGGVNYQWSTGQTSSSIVVSPTSTTTYSVTITSAEGCTATDEVVVFVNSASVDAGPDVTMCLNKGVSLTATGGGSYLWSNGMNTATISVNPPVTTTYSVTVTENGCTAVDQVTVTVEDVTAVTGPDQTICLGESATLTASGGTSYLWSNGQTSSTITVSPTSTTTYQVIVSNGNDCQDIAMVTVAVGNASADAGMDQTICNGEFVTLTASGGTFFQWSTGQTSSSITVSPAATTNYSVTVSDANGCSGVDNVTVTVGNVNANAGPDQTICGGESVVLSATGGSTYVWSTGEVAQSITVSPTSTTTYTVIVMDENGCSDTDQVTVFVGGVTASAGPDATICSGNPVTLTASGGTSYQWSNGSTSASITVNPTATTTFSVTVSDSVGCTDSDSVTVTVGSVTAEAGPDQDICLGSSATLTASGGGAYLWNTGETTQSITVSPAQNSTYTVIVTSPEGCTDTDQVHVNVGNGNGGASAGDDQNICAGESAILNATGGVSYAWSNGQTSASIVVNPSATTTYSVTVTDANGCSGVDQLTVNVGTATADAGADQIMCLGKGASLVATGGVNYLWSTGQNTAVIDVDPTSTTTYTVTVTDGNGCSDTDQVTVEVTSVTASAGPDVTITAGQSATLTATGGSSFVWSTNETSQTIIVSPTTTTIYIVLVSDGNGCSEYAEVTVFVTPGEADPILLAQASPDQMIDEGECTNVSVTHNIGVTYVWSNGAAGEIIDLCPEETTTYSVTVTDANGNTVVDFVTITVQAAAPILTAQASPDQSIFVGDCTNVSVTHNIGVTYVWSNGAAGEIIDLCPEVTTTYSVTVTDANGNTVVDFVTITVDSIPDGLVADAGASQFLCGTDGGATLTATGGSNYLWSTGDTNSSITVFPTVTTTYEVTVTNAAGEMATDEVTVFVGSLDVQVTRDCTQATTFFDTYDVIIAFNDGVAPYQIVATNAAGETLFETSSADGSSVSFEVPNTSEGYTLSITDDGGCNFSQNNLGLEPCITVDVELVSFDAEVEAEGNSLKWVTISETNNSHFALHHSSNGTDWTPIATIDGAGNANSTNNYSYLDKTAPSGISYYYLTQTDFDGATRTVSEIVSLVRGEVALTFTNVTQVGQYEFNVGFTSDKAQVLQAIVFDMSGRAMFRQSVEATEGENSLQLEIASMPAGMYVLSLDNGVEVITVKLVKGNN